MARPSWSDVAREPCGGGDAITCCAREPASLAMLLGYAVGDAITHHFSARLAGAPLKSTEARESFQHALELAHGSRRSKAGPPL